MLEYPIASLLRIDDELAQVYDSEGNGLGLAGDGTAANNSDAISVSGEIGIIKGVFDNDVSVELFRIVLVVFPTPEGLNLVNDNFFLQTEYSGGPRIILPSLSGEAVIRPGALEH